MSCWLCGSGREWLHTSLPTLYVDGVPIFEALGDATTSHGRILQGSDGGRSSKTCQVLGLSDTCCLTLVFAATPYMVGLFLIIKCHPRNALISVTVLALTTYFLSYVAWVEFLSCVVSLFIMNLCQLFATVGFLIRRRAVYKSGWLDKQPEDRENPIARVIENAMRAGRRDGSANPGSGIGEAVRASIRGGEVLASASGQSAQNRYSSTSSPACRGGRSPDHSQHRGARGMDGGGLGGRAASISESLSDMLFEIRDEMGSRTQAARAEAKRGRAHPPEGRGGVATRSERRQRSSQLERGAAQRPISTRRPPPVRRLATWARVKCSFAAAATSWADATMRRPATKTSLSTLRKAAAQMRRQRTIRTHLRSVQPAHHSAPPRSNRPWPLRSDSHRRRGPRSALRNAPHGEPRRRHRRRRRMRHPTCMTSPSSAKPSDGRACVGCFLS